MAFKMKGSSLYGKINLNRGGQANRPDGRAKSSAFQKDVQGGVTPTVDVSGGDKTERHADKFDRVKKEATKGNDDTRTAKFAAEYGGTWTRQGNVYRNQDGQSVKEAAKAQGQKKSQEKRDYVAKNTTKKAGAPMKKSPMEKGETSKMGKLKALGKGISATWRASATENIGDSIMHGKQAYKKSKKESRDADQKAGAPMKASPMQANVPTKEEAKNKLRASEEKSIDVVEKTSDPVLESIHSKNARSKYKERKKIK